LRFIIYFNFWFMIDIKTNQLKLSISRWTCSVFFFMLNDWWPFSPRKMMLRIMQLVYIRTYKLLYLYMLTRSRIPGHDWFHQLLCRPNHCALRYRPLLNLESNRPWMLASRSNSWTSRRCRLRPNEPARFLVSLAYHHRKRVTVYFHCFNCLPFAVPVIHLFVYCYFILFVYKYNV